MDKLQCLTLNVRGLRNKDKRSCLFNYLDSKNIHVHVALLQETFCTRDYKDNFDADWSGTIFHSFAPSNHDKGVCILIKNDMIQRTGVKKI